MATTQEEIQIRLGVDAKALISGLDSATGYVKSWSKKRKSIEEDYAQWWSRELKDRSERELQEEIRSATRRNRARELWRTRAKNRELKIAEQQAQAERLISEQNAARIAAQRSGFGFQAMQGLGRKAVSLLKANVYMAAAEMLTSLLPTADEFWDSVYGVDEKSTKAYEEQNNRLHALRDKVKDLKLALDKAYEDRNLRNADNAGKEAIFESNLATNQTALAKAEANVKLMKQAHAGAEKIAEAENKVREIKLEQLEIEQKLSEVRGQMDIKELRESIRRRANRKEEVDRLRSDYKTNLELGNLADAEQNKQDIARIIAQRNALEGLPPGVDVNAFLRSTNPNMPYVPSGADNAKATYDAFTKAIKENTLYVLVKGVEGE